MIMAAEKRMVAFGYSPPINSTDFLPQIRVENP
jgi:hypothetical protein